MIRPTINPGGTPVSNIYMGTTPVKVVYAGAKQIWPLAYYYDDFNGRTSLGSDWLPNPGTLSNPTTRVIGNAAHGGQTTMGTGRQASCWTLYNSGTMYSNDFYVRAQLTTPNYSQANNNYTSLFFGANDTLTEMYNLSVSTGSGSYLVRLSGGIPDGSGGAATGGSRQTNLASAGNVSATSLIEIRKVGTTLSAHVNGVQTMSATISATTVGTRRWGFCIEGNYPILQTRYSSAGIDWIEAGDL